MADRSGFIQPRCFLRLRDLEEVMEAICDVRVVLDLIRSLLGRQTA